MKKTLVFTLVLTLILSVASFVNAATVNANATLSVSTETAKNGDTVTVTVKLSTPVKCGELFINYDKDVLTLAGKPTELGGFSTIDSTGSTDGHIGYGFFGTGATIDTITYVFNVVGENGTSSDVTVVATPNQFRDAEENNVEFTANTVKVTVGETSPEPSTPGSSEPSSEPSTPGSSASTPAGNSGKEPTSMPQTGVNVAYVAGAVVLALAAGYVVSKKD